VRECCPEGSGVRDGRMGFVGILGGGDTSECPKSFFH